MQRRFPQYAQILVECEKPGDFLHRLAAALPPDLSPRVAGIYSLQLDSFVYEMLSHDLRFVSRPGVDAGIQALRDRLSEATSPPPTPAQMAAAVARVDAFSQSLLSDSESAQEALDWLRAGGKRCTLGEMASTAVSVRLVNTVYRAGAVKVWAVEIDRSPNGRENTGRLVIELPQEASARAQVLKWASRKSSAQGFGGIEDGGQRYVFVMLD
ncbi:MAG: hypothetical protein P4L99_02015 [Chthoniobacter sp.]|nr:hypothetical protein [Chthoniobacter sp.]